MSEMTGVDVENASVASLGDQATREGGFVKMTDSGDARSPSVSTPDEKLIKEGQAVLDKMKRVPNSSERIRKSTRHEE